MKNFLIFLAGALTGAGVGIFCYKKYKEYKAVIDEETAEETAEETNNTDSETNIAEPVNNPKKTSYNTPMSISDEDLETEKSKYSACFERYRNLKERDAAKEANAMNTTNGELELISESDYRMDVYPCYTYEYHIESKELFDPNGDRIDDDYSKIFGEYTDEIIKVLEDPDGDSAIYLRDHDNEEDYEIIAVLS